VFDGVHTCIITTAARPDQLDFEGPKTHIYTTSGFQNFFQTKFNVSLATLKRHAEAHVM